MIDKVRHTLRTYAMVTPNEPLWVGVSGGVDSMVLLDILLALGHPCRVVHIDHGLRGAESAADRALVQDHCARLGIPCRVEEVDVAAATGGGRSVQMAARMLRLRVFRRLLKAGPHKLALAHHADDVVETFFMHLVRGMGVRGWNAIPPVAGPVIRPFIETDRDAIMHYAERKGIPFREDASNSDPKYLRNRVRHELMPVFWSMRQGARQVMVRNMQHFREMGALAERESGMFQGDGDRTDGSFLSFERLLSSPAPLTVLHALFTPFGFHPDQLREMWTAVQESHFGAKFMAGEHEVFVERDGLSWGWVQRNRITWTIHAPTALEPGLPLSIEECTADDMDLGAGQWVAWMDGDHVRYPLVVRRWKPGDRLHPLGMAGTKLVSDILTDAKVPARQRKEVMVMEGPDGVLWIPGLRAAHHVRVRPGTSRILRLEWKGARIFNQGVSNGG